MYRSGQNDRNAPLRAVSVAISALQDVGEALPWLELGLFAVLVLGIVLN